MDMSHGSSDGSTTAASCQISMLWNWYTIDFCFLSEQAHIRSVGAFVGAIVGVVVIVIALEALRRLSRDYDRQIKRSFHASLAQIQSDSSIKDELPAVPLFRPTFSQHLVRSIFYTIQFGTAYILMLLGMTYNGYILFAIFFGGFVGYLLCARDTATDHGDDSAAGRGECCV
ncbi:BQ5605_C004g02765 [Microbotryum silenes-dioicae]|uniref:Copper transport protein n=1 Tax=Microbotryum silenes-dioicae TaxID=796604 RepID=A0A2X0PB34_9BASI|nr:BQ5605_C004g02765 [Microbotryum silenes-dioicae]